MLVLVPAGKVLGVIVFGADKSGTGMRSVLASHTRTVWAGGEPGDLRRVTSTSTVAGRL